MKHLKLDQKPDIQRRDHSVSGVIRKGFLVELLRNNDTINLEIYYSQID